MRGLPTSCATPAARRPTVASFSERDVSCWACLAFSCAVRIAPTIRLKDAPSCPTSLPGDSSARRRRSPEAIFSETAERRRRGRTTERSISMNPMRTNATTSAAIKAPPTDVAWPGRARLLFGGEGNLHGRMDGNQGGDIPPHGGHRNRLRPLACREENHLADVGGKFRQGLQGERLPRPRPCPRLYGVPDHLGNGDRRLHRAAVPGGPDDLECENRQERERGDGDERQLETEACPGRHGRLQPA